MPNVTIYVPDDLFAALATSDVKVSATCQAALRRKLRVIERQRAALNRQTHAAGVRLDATGRPTKPAA